MLENRKLYAEERFIYASREKEERLYIKSDDFEVLATVIQKAKSC